MPYETLEHTADIGIKVSAETPEELFVDSAKGMFEIIADTRLIKPQEKIQIEREADGYAELLVEWLRELLYQYSVTEIVFNEFSVLSLHPNFIKAIAWGDKAKSGIKAEIKAVTYHELEFKKTESGYEAKVIFDV